jgi:3' terminal RNA ribose 2'-O-methyltransferase Hen1
VAIAQVFGSALGGRSKDRPELAEAPIDLEIEISALPCRGGEDFLRNLFEPMGYTVEAAKIPLAPRFPEWGEGSLFSVKLKCRHRLQDPLSHLYVLLPVLDNDKHYWIGKEEVDKLLVKGERWLKDHPLKEEIVNRYLRRKKFLTQDALARLVSDDTPDLETRDDEVARKEEVLEENVSLNEQRLGSVIAALKSCGAAKVLDLGCGEGNLLRRLLKEPVFRHIVGTDVSYRSLETAMERLRIDRLPEKQKERIQLFQSSITYRDDRFSGFDAACAIEVIEHLEPGRLIAFERAVFEFAKPITVIVTTPNVEYNTIWETLPAGDRRHPDHRFEWNRQEFQSWGNRVGEKYGYSATYLPVGPVDPEKGPPTQMGVFSR